MTTLLERVQNRGHRICRVLDNIKETKKLSDEELRLESNRQRMYEREHEHHCLDYHEDRWKNLMNWHGNIERWPHGDDARASNEVYTRSMTRETFEKGLRSAIDYYEKQESLDNREIQDLSYLKFLLAEHEATPYR